MKNSPFSPMTESLINALRCLPGVGPKTAQRMAFELLSNKRDQARELGLTLNAVIEHIHFCQRCRNFTEEKLCQICAEKNRDFSQLCVVETPADIAAIEQTGIYKGYYFVLMGHLSPLDGIGPEDLGIELLEKRLTDKKLIEIILATNHTAEGEATAHYIAEIAKPLKLRMTRIAHGVPLGGELSYIDNSTLSEAIFRRRVFEI